jgi:hypothetical protein
VLGIANLGDAADVNPVIKFLPHVATPQVDSSDCLHDPVSAVVNHVARGHADMILDVTP